MNWILTVFLVVAVIVAGCGAGPPSTSTSQPQTEETPIPSTPTATPVTVTVTGGELPVDATAVWLRTLRLKDLDPGEHEPPSVVVGDPVNGTQQFELFKDMYRPEHPDFRGDDLNFGERVGIGQTTLRVEWGQPVGGYAHGHVMIRPNGGSPHEVEATLVHEYAHHLQNVVIQDELLWRAVTEGGAVYVETKYAQKYLDGIDPAREVRHRYENETDGGTMLWVGLYYHGYRHFEQRIDSPAEISTVYDAPPETFTQLLHGLPPENAQPGPLAVNVDATVTTETVELGELVLQTVLRTELDGPPATSAATGWDADRLTMVAGHDLYVWTIRMENGTHATELEAALGNYLDSKAARDGTSWTTETTAYRVVRTTDETVTLILGDRVSVESMTVTVTGESVRITLPPDAENQVG